MAVCLLILALLAALPSHSVGAVPALTATYTVDRTDDSTVNSGCDDGLDDDDCGLRGAISLANGLPAGSVITINLPAGTYVLALTGTGENGNLTGDLDVLLNDIRLEGAGSDLTILSANSIDRVIDHHSGRLSISSLEITAGQTAASSMGGAGILNRTGAELNLLDVAIEANAVIGTNPNLNYGGGIANFGPLLIHRSAILANSACNGGGISTYEDTLVTITETTISNNTTNKTGPQATCTYGRGGGIYMDRAEVEIRDSSIYDNETYYGGGIYNNYSVPLTLTGVTLNSNAAFISGGGIANYGTLGVSNSTISSNSAGTGGGLHNYGTGNATIEQTTFANNTATVSTNGFSLAAEVGSVQSIHNSILASTSLTNATCFFGTPSTFTDGGHNLSSDHSCQLNPANHNLIDTDPMLGSLADHGGPTHTLALLDGSPAIDTADPEDFLAKDQRGYYRPGTGSSLPDIGAYEWNGFSLDLLFYMPILRATP